jgi:hypothetical protein
MCLAEKTRPCLISCSVLKEELKALVERGDLDVDLVFVSKYFHVDFSLIEKNLRATIEKTMSRSPHRIVLVYGDLCLGLNDEMKTLAAEYGITKVEALNCVDCLFGGKGKSLEADPDHELMIMNPGMIDFFERMKETAIREGLDAEALKAMFNGLKGIVLLDTVGEADKNRLDLERVDTGLPVLETKVVGLENLKRAVLEAIGRPI